MDASLYGFVTSNNDSVGLEIKSPFLKHNPSLSKAFEDKKFCLIEKQKVELKRGHSYFYQIQCRILCTGMRRIDLVVWFGDQEPLFVLPIFYDEEFINSCISLLKFFYCQAVLPEFYTKRVQRVSKLYLHPFAQIEANKEKSYDSEE